MKLNTIITAAAVIAALTASVVAVTKAHEVEAYRALDIAECEYERFEQGGSEQAQYLYTCEEEADQTFADWKVIYSENKEATLDDLF